MTHRFRFLLFLLFLSTLAHAQTSDVKLEDYIYNEAIKTVLLYPASDRPENPTRLIGPPLVALEGTRPLVLEFDDLTADYRGFRAKLIHCNADWTKSALNDIEYTFEFNDYPITDFQQSFSTKVPYYHYRLEVPRVKLSGNYVLAVYSERDRRPVLSRRFMVYQTKVRIAAQARFSQGIQQQFSDQQIDFSIDYKGYPLVSPQNDLKVVMRQNFRWDRAKSNFKPTNVRPFDQVLEYQFFNLENTFRGGNEFRYFDSRTLAARGFGVYELERLSEYTRLVLTPDKLRSDGSYLQMDDLNGQYLVDHRESGRGSVEADYTPVVFTLRIAEVPDATLYVNGGFNLWQLNDLNRMEYNPDLQAYHAVLLLKQGVVNYNYAVVNTASGLADEAYVEGNFAATENDYDILVYHRPPAGRSDLLIGYRTVEWNRR
ncbi:DUF5103 domain-containing protein [Rhabdobacter roseus]|uniref:Type 9 secretion system plug protein N-terminal domain-containing protein n=1 Tax=Rhabdobacter roseus TaxID=1655419 RepID=A0A840TSJ5_9BACT|nr:DUF5103 domain-containing protein [Rhabdobacter roseus]MBB5282669.1 hypothetical protein [Rhabdobacter roseus]